MSTVAKRATGRRRRVVGVLATLLIGGAGAALAPGAYAQTAPAGTADVAPVNGAGTTIDSAAVRYADTRGAVRATHALPTPGAHGTAFQAPLPSMRITGGSLANVSDYPYMVGIETIFLGSDGYWWIRYCTGTVLSSTKVLTAGHCATEAPFGTSVVIAGRNDLDNDTGGYVARVATTWTHQGYNIAAMRSDPNQVPVDDVAVLTLKDTLPAAYTPVTLTAQGDSTPYAAGTSATILGYGVTQSGAADPGILRMATIAIPTEETCSTLGGYDPTRMVCAGATGIDTCGGDSGGPLMVSGVEAGITDWGYDPCGSTYGVYERVSAYSDLIKTDLTRPSLINLDWSGDGHTDLMARDSSGRLYEYSGSGFADDGNGGFAGSGIIGSGWQGYTKLFRVTNWNGDGNESIMGRDSSGNLYQYRGDGQGGFLTGTREQVGHGWNSFTDIMVTNNWTGDGHPNLMGRTSTGDLYLYTSDGNGGWLNNGYGIKIGTGWNSFNTVLTPGNWAGDGYQALIGRTPAGDLYLYKSDGHGGWQNNGIGILIGTGWNMFSIFMSPGDWNGDDMIDMIGITPGGSMSLYKTDGHGNWLNPMGQTINAGWNSFNAVF